MAERRYRDMLEHYLCEVQHNPALTLKAYGRMKHVYHGRMSACPGSSTRLSRSTTFISSPHPRAGSTCLATSRVGID